MCGSPWERAMTARILVTTFDCRDAVAIANFWATALGYEIRHREEITFIPTRWIRPHQLRQVLRLILSPLDRFFSERDGLYWIGVFQRTVDAPLSPDDNLAGADAHADGRRAHVGRPRPARGGSPVPVPRAVLAARSHWAWLAGGFVLAFAVPFLLTHIVHVSQNLFTGLYALAVSCLFAGWVRTTGYDIRVAIRRRWPMALALGTLGAILLSIIVMGATRTRSPSGTIKIAADVIWGGIVYGVTDALLLSVFPILLLFAALGTTLGTRARGKAAIAAASMLVSLGLTVTNLAGYNHFRPGKIAEPLTGDLIWSVPTLLTLNPIASPIAHAGLHVSAVLQDHAPKSFLHPHT